MMRDKRVDYLGLVGQLQKQYADDVKSMVKLAMTNKGEDRATGDSFAALLTTGVITTVDPEKFLRLYERKEITRAQFLAAIKVQRDVAIDAVSRDELARISTEAPASPSLRVTPIKGIKVELVDAVREIAAAIDCAARNRDAA